MDPNKEPGLRIGQVFLLSAAFRHRGDVLSRPSGSPHQVDEVGIEIKTLGLEGDDGKNAGAIILRVFTKPELESAYEFSVEMMGIVDAIEGQENYPPDTYVREVGAAMMLPFIREALANITQRGRFGPVWIAPFNVRRLVHQAPPQVPA